MFESTASFSERKPFLCFICENPIETSKSYQNDGKTKSSNVQVSRLFCSIVSRYLNFKSFQATTSKTISISTSTDDKNAETLDCCKCCSVIVKTVCELYDELKNLQLRLNWNLGKIGEIMKKSNQSANTQLSCDDMGKEDFKRQFMEKVDTNNREQSPHLKLDKITPPKGPIQQNLENQNVYIIKLETYNDDDDGDEEDVLSGHDNHDEDTGELDIKVEMETENHNDIESPVEPEESPKVNPEQAEEQHKIVAEAEIKTKRKHQKKIPDPEKKFPCAFCEKRLAGKKTLWKHERIFHKGEKLYPCPTCGERFSNMQERKNHEVSNHEKVKCQDKAKVKCRFCGKPFPRNKERVRHEWTHTKLKPFLCSVCGRRFNDSGNSIKHLRKEHGNVDDAKIVKCFNSYRDFKNIGPNNTEIKTAV